MDKELRDDMLKLVRYKILFVRREYEYTFPEREDLVPDNMDESSFAAWKTAEFIQELQRKETRVPEKWKTKNYPPAKFVADSCLTGLPDEDKKYLRVYFEVLDRYPREKFKYEEQQIRVLEQIRDNVEKSRSSDAGKVDPYEEMMNRLRLSNDAFAKWREDFKRFCAPFSKDIAQAFNEHRSVGHFQAVEVTAAELSAAFKKPVFDRKVFDMFTGPAEGDLRIFYPQPGGAPPQVIPTPKVLSIWGAVKEQAGSFTQRITGASRAYINPHSLPDVWENLAVEKVDLIFNAHTEDLGTVSWSVFYQNHKNQLRSIGYPFGEKKLLWVNQLLDPDMKPTIGPLPTGGEVRENQFVLSIDAEEIVDGKRRFLVYAMHLDFDFQKGRAVFAGPILKMLNEVVSL